MDTRHIEPLSGARVSKDGIAFSADQIARLTDADFRTLTGLGASDMMLDRLRMFGRLRPTGEVVVDLRLRAVIVDRLGGVVA